MAEKMNIYQKLGVIQRELNAPKSNYNSFGDYNYRSQEDILEALKPLLEKVGAIVTLNDEIVQVGDRYYVKATATLINADGEGFIGATAYAKEEESKKGMDGSQLTGATSSYARKYALNGLFAIDDTKDSDYTNKHGKDDVGQNRGQSAPAKKPPADKDLEVVKKLLKEVGMSDSDFGAYLQSTYKKRWVELNKNEKSKAIQHLQDLKGA